MVTLTVMEPGDIDSAWFNLIILVDDGYSDDDVVYNTGDIVSDVKMSKKKMTVEQSEMLTLFMKGHPDFTKGKQKTSEETVSMNVEWQQLISDLNDMGPPTHSSSEWRRVWTNMKSNKKKRSQPDTVIESKRPNIDVTSVTIPESSCGTVTSTVSFAKTIKRIPIPESTSAVSYGKTLKAIPVGVQISGGNDAESKNVRKTDCYSPAIH